jgi:hypothetical protein
MAMAAERRLELAERWRGIQEDEEAEDGGEPYAARHRRLMRAKEEWYVRLRPFQVSSHPLRISLKAERRSVPFVIARGFSRLGVPSWV